MGQATATTIPGSVQSNDNNNQRTVQANNAQMAGRRRQVQLRGHGQTTIMTVVSPVQDPLPQLLAVVVADGKQKGIFLFVCFFLVIKM
jgi:hypothetical protein